MFGKVLHLPIDYLAFHKECIAPNGLHFFGRMIENTWKIHDTCFQFSESFL